MASCRSILMYVWYGIPFRNARSLAASISGSGRRMVTVFSEIFRLAVPAAIPRRMISPATRLPSRLSHQSASSSVVLKFGILIGFVFFCIGLFVLKVHALLPLRHSIASDNPNRFATHGIHDRQQPPL